MIYIIDNGRDYSDHGIYFIEAPPSFGVWFTEKFMPWMRAIRRQVPTIIGVAETIAWRVQKSGTPTDFIEGYRHDCLAEQPFPEYESTEAQ